MPELTKVLFIGLDSADKDLILRWADDGLMPNIRKLRDESAWGLTTRPAGLGNGAMWPSFFTGVWPGRHGRYFFRQIKRGTYYAEKFQAIGFKHEPFWATIGRAGRKVAVMDLPKAPLTENLNGIQIADCLLHNYHYPNPVSWPAALADEIASRFGRDQVGPCDAHNRSLAEFRTLRDNMVDRIHTKAKLACHYLDQGGWDLYLTAFADSHCAGHQCWHIHDPSHPLHDAEMARELGDPIKDVYLAMDEALGTLLERAGPETTVIVFTGDGIGPNYTGNYMMDQILRAIEGAPKSSTVSALDGIKAAYRAVVPAGLRRRVRSVADKVDESSLTGDRAARKCFALPHNDISGAVRVNLVGREPDGKIQPGAEYDEFCADLTRDLLALVNADTGARVVDEVVRPVDQYQGEHLDDLPDLFVVWNRDAPISAVRSDKTGEIRMKYPGNRTGDHKPLGMFFARGPGIVPQRLSRIVPVVDFAPTMATLLGVDLPDMDGEPIADLCSGVKPLEYA